MIREAEAPEAADTPTAARRGKRTMCSGGARTAGAAAFFAAFAASALLGAMPAGRAYAQGEVPPPPSTGGVGTGGATSGQQGAPGSPAPGAPGAPGQGGPGAGGPPPLPVLLGYADLLLTLDRPWRAEPLYKLVLMQDPNNAVAKQGLAEAQMRKRPGLTALAHTYYDSQDVQLVGYGGGLFFNTPLGKVTLTAGDGYYKNNNNPNNRRNPIALSPLVPNGSDNFSLDRQTYNLLFEPFWGDKMQHEAAAWLSYQSYDGVPDRFLYDFHYSYIAEPGRKKYTIGTGRKDSFFQSQVNQFLAPESYFVLAEKITFDDYYASVDYPLSKKIDFSFNYRNFQYSDGNVRNNYRTLFMYRIKPDSPMKPMPVWRVGLDGIIDEAKFFTLKYGIPRDFRSLSIATDYAMLTRDYKVVVYASVPVAQKNFAAPAGLVGYVSKSLDKEKRYEVYGKTVILQGRNLSRSLYDYVVGVNARF
jgi:hypothetical protein